MITSFLSSLIVFCLLIAYVTRKHRRMEEQAVKNFWDREARANNTRKKPLDHLPYITIPFDSLPVQTMKDDPVVAECMRLLTSLSSQKIVNLTGYTNTDLKLEYGTANITPLTEYDQNYTLLVRTLQDWAESLYAAGFEEDARMILEFAVSTMTDVSHTYYLLADIYDKNGESSKKASLIETASGLRSPMKAAIIRTLEAPGPYSSRLNSV